MQHDAPPWRPAPGTTIDGRYRLDRELGAGPVGVTWLAYDQRLGEVVAVKVLHPALFEGPHRGPNILRLQRARAFVHDHVVRLRDVVTGTASDGRFYVVTDFVAGRDLAAWTEQHGATLTTSDALGLMRQVVAALEWIHQLGVHGNLKPSNVFVDEAGAVRVGDPWYLDGRSGIPGSDLPARGEGWAAPEQRVDTWAEGPEADVHGLAFLFGLLVGGRRPTGAIPLIAQGLSVPPAVDDVFERATAPEPAKRHRDVRTFWAALEAACADLRLPLATEGVATAAGRETLVGVAPRAPRRPPSGDTSEVAFTPEILDGDPDVTLLEPPRPLEDLDGHTAAMSLAELADYARSLGHEGDLPAPPVRLDLAPADEDEGPIAFGAMGPPRPAPAGPPTPPPDAAPEPTELVGARILATSPDLESAALELSDIVEVADDSLLDEALDPTLTTASDVVHVIESSIIEVTDASTVSGGEAVGVDDAIEATGLVEEAIEVAPPNAPPVPPAHPMPMVQVVSGTVEGSGPPRPAPPVGLPEPSIHLEDVSLVEVGDSAIVGLADASVLDATDPDATDPDHTAPGHGRDSRPFETATLPRPSLVGMRAADPTGPRGPRTETSRDVSLLVSSPATAGAPGAAKVPVMLRRRRNPMVFVAIGLAALALVVAGLVVARLVGDDGPTTGAAGPTPVAAASAEFPPAPARPAVPADTDAATALVASAPGESPQAADAGARADQAAGAAPPAEVDPLVAAAEATAGQGGGARAAEAQRDGADAAAVDGAAEAPDAEAESAVVVAAVGQGDGADAGDALAAGDDGAGDGKDDGGDDDEPEVAGAEAPRTRAAFVPTDPDALKCPAGMARIRRKVTVTLDDGAKVQDWNVYCIERHEFPGAGRPPRTNVSLGEAKAACKARGRRLCTRSEWRGACGGKYPYGSTYDPKACNMVADNGLPRPLVASGSLARCKSGWGTYDMVGNAAEWTSDGYVNGGSAYKDGESGTCGRSSRRTGGHPYVGFRCCADAEAE